MTSDNKLRTLTKILGEPLIRGNEASFSCPSPNGCKGRHHKRKLSVNLRTDWYHCWVCGFSGGNLAPLFRLSSDRGDLERYLADRKQTDQQPEKQFVTPRLPDDFVPLVERNTKSPCARAVVTYLKSRGMTDDDALLYKLGYCENGPYRGRVIIPSFDSDGELNFFVGRTIYDTEPAKYKHGIFDKDIVFNDYLVDWTEPVILTEGPFDAMRAGHNAIALQGSFMREGSLLMRKIVMSGVDVFLAMDADARDKQLKILSLLHSHGVRVRWVDVGKWAKDVGDMERGQLSIAMDTARRIDDEFDLLRLRAALA